jgi:hypothetical protein
MEHMTMGYVMTFRPLFGLRTSSTAAITRLGSSEDFDDISSSIGDAASPDGEALAKEFYQQIRQRDEGGQDDVPRTTGSVTSPVTSRKYVGQSRSSRNPSEPSAGLFSGRGVSVYSVPRATPRQRMMENEFNLVGRNETTLLIQIAVTLAFLTFALYIGMTGGITSNDWSTIPDSIDTNMEGIEGLLPVPTDTEVSLWL